MAFAIRNILFVFGVLAVTVTAQENKDGSCGVPNKFTELIDHDEHVQRGDFPWLVALMSMGTKTPLFLCSGTIISSTFVITGRLLR